MDPFTEVDTTQSQQQQPDPNKDYLAELVGEDKKFKTPQDLARGKAEADSLIQRMQRENAELREELNKRLTAEDLVKKLEERTQAQQGSASSQQDTTPAGQTTQTEAGGSSAQLDLEEVQKLLDNRLTEREKAQAEERNLNYSISEMNKAWGDNTQVELNRKAKTLGISVDQLKGYAKSNPSVFLALVGVSKPEQHQEVRPQVPAQSSTNPAAMPSTSGVKNQSYYQRMRKEDPKKYFHKDTQIEMHNEAVKQGEAFFS